MSAIWILTCCLVGVDPAFATVTPTPTNPSDIFKANARLGRGINLANALEAPMEGEWGVVLEADDFKNVKRAGFDSVRLPIKWSANAKTTPPYTIDPAFARRVDWAIGQATTNGLNIIINVHHYNEMDENPDAHAKRLKAIWKQIAERYKKRPDSVYFELYNEPHGNLDAARWNALIPELLRIIRATNPHRPVIVGPAEWNGIHALNSLKLPDDPNLIVTVHFYEPFHFTHQGAEWVEGAKDWLGTTWTGTEEERKLITEKFDQALEFSRRTNRPIFVGEFGAYSKADEASRVRWTRFVVEQCQRCGFSWCYWELRAGFGAYDYDRKAWREPLRQALLESTSLDLTNPSRP